MDMRQAIAKVVRNDPLTEPEAYDSAVQIMEGKATDAQIAALLVSLRLKGETVNEVAGFVRAMREKATPVPLRGNHAIDTCGTGGDGCGTFNVSTISALVAAGAGCTVAKHGNRSVSSRCGSADVLAELGVRVDLLPQQIIKCIEEAGIGFLFAPSLHKAMKHAAGPRREIGIRTVFNLIGPLTNPTGTKRQLVGVFDRHASAIAVDVLARMGSEHVVSVHGEGGMDEMTVTGTTWVLEHKFGKKLEYTVEPEDVGLKRASPESIQGGDPAFNADIALRILGGEKGPKRDMVLLNAGAAVYVAGQAATLREGVEKAKESIDSGEAIHKLKRLRELSGMWDRPECVSPPCPSPAEHPMCVRKRSDDGI